MARVRQAGDSALLLELEPVIDPHVNARAIAIAAAVRERAPAGVRDVVSTYRSVAVYFDPLVLDRRVVHALLEDVQALEGVVSGGRTIEVPVVYGGAEGPDLADVASRAGLTPGEVIARHAGTDYRVFMLGFLPGFAYLGTVPPEIAVPRHASPRSRVPGGSVGIAGRQTAIYPCDSPGGWRIVGRTGLRVFDLHRTPPALLRPGDTVRFVPAREPAEPRTPAPAARPPAPATGRTVTVLTPGLFTTVQDGGRWGHQSLGVPVSGALDPFAHRLANALVGNPGDAAALEATVSGPELRMEDDVTVAITGADCPAAVADRPLAANVPVRARRGEIVRVGPRRAGGRAYIAFDGGVAVAPVLGSRSTHAITGMGGVGGRSLAAGDRLPIGPPGRTPARRVPELPRVVTTGGVRVRVLPGPQDDVFPPETFEALQRHRFSVTARADRMGFRLAGVPLRRHDAPEMISDATFTGAIQVPASGDPILLMADRQTTGGYPQIATVITADLPLAAQLVPGDWIEFEVCSHREAIAALVAQEGKLLGVS